MNNKYLLIAGILALILILAGAADTLYFIDKTYPGVTIGERDVSFLNDQEIKEELEALGFEQQEVLFKFLDEEEKYNLEELGIRLDFDSLSEKALLIGRKGSFQENIQERLKVFREGKDIPLCFIIDEKKIDILLNQLAAEIKVEPVNADFDVKVDEISIIPGKNGMELDEEKSKSSFYETLMSLGEFNSLVEFPVLVMEIEPETTTECLQATGITDMLTKFHTVFNENDKNRNQNIKLASGLINLTMLAPGEVFSFNQVVGRATAERGFKEAPIIVGGQFVPGIGGGICQVSSTLYNAALLSSMEIVERANHGRAVGYLPVGRDATISYGYLDLKFKNTRSDHVLISSRVEGNKLVMRFFGNPVPEERVEIVTSDVVKIEPEIKTEVKKDMKPGEKELVQTGSPGYRVTVWRIIYKGEEEIQRERLSRDYYKPAPAIYHVGPRKEEDVKVITPENENSEEIESTVEEEENIEEAELEDVG